MKFLTKNNKKGMQYMKAKKFNVKKKIQAPSCEHNKNYVLQPVIQLLHIFFCVASLSKHGWIWAFGHYRSLWLQPDMGVLALI